MTTTTDDTTLEQSWSDILEWLHDAGLEQTVANLRPPASDDAIARTEAALGLRMPDGLRWLYARHDGQRTLERYPLFRWLAFLPLERVDAERDGMLLAYFGVHSPGAPVREDALYDDPDEPLRAEERNEGWWPFASEGGDFYAVHVETGRVVWILKGEVPAIRVVADSVEAFLYDYANQLWNDELTVLGDPDEPGVEEEGIITLGAYVR